MSTVEEIKQAIEQLPPKEQARLRDWIYATEAKPDTVALEQALAKGMKAAREGRVKSVDEVRGMIPKWVGK